MLSILSDLTGVCRKPKTCDQCLRLIEIGQRYRKQVVADGSLQTYRAHEDCDNASSAHMAISGYDPRYDDPRALHEALCPEDMPWLRETFPLVAARLTSMNRIENTQSMPSA